MIHPSIQFPTDDLAAFCQRWRIARLEIFGSALRDDFRPDSDVDLLVTFAPEARWSLLDLDEMEEDLAGLIGRKVDLVSRRGLERSQNWLRRRAILGSAEPVYVGSG